MFILYLIAVIISLLIVFFAFFILVILVNLVFLLKTGVPYVTSGKECYNEIFNRTVSVSGATVYDLGCGNGEFLFEAARYGAKKCIGYELSFFPFLLGFIRSIFQGEGRVNIYWGDFMKADLSKANIIYLYLVPRVINKIYNKIIKEVSPGTIIIIKGSSLLNHEPDDKIIFNNLKNYGLYIYKIK